MTVRNVLNEINGYPKRILSKLLKSNVFSHEKRILIPLTMRLALYF